MRSRRKQKTMNLPVENDKYCMGCRYYRMINGGEQMYCSYIFEEDRKRPCDPGKDCTVKKKRRGKKDA